MVDEFGRYPSGPGYDPFGAQPLRVFVQASYPYRGALMRDRERIDWQNLEPLPRRKRDVGATRDDLAERKFNIQKAKHKGRCHITNQKRRQIAQAKAQVAKHNTAVKLSAYRAFKVRVRAFWRGELEEHP